MGICFGFVDNLESKIEVEVVNEIPHIQTEFSYLKLEGKMILQKDSQSYDVAVIINLENWNSKGARMTPITAKRIRETSSPSLMRCLSMPELV